MSETLGWRHFRVTQTRKLGRQPHVYLLLQASCDPGAQLWVHAQVRGGCKPRQRQWGPGCAARARMRC